jgi:NitT/TauT family transport system substrate-binding protein
MLTRRATIASFGAAALASGLRPARAQLVKIKVGEVFRSQFYTPMYVALGKGFVNEQGLEVELISAGGGDRVGALVLSDGCDFGLAGPEVAMYMYNGESPDKPLIFCALTGSDGYFLVSKDKIDNFQWSMLNGKKTMAQRPGSTPELCFEYLLKQNKVDPETIKSLVTNIGPAAREGAWLGGGYDFALFIEPSLTKLERAGQVHVITSIGKEVGRVEYTSFFAKKSWLAKNGDVAQKWTNAIAKAQAWMRTAKVEEIAQSVTPFFPNVTIEDHVAVINRYLHAGAPIWATSPEVDKGGIERLQEFMIIGGVLAADKKVPYDAVVTREYSSKAQALVSKT